MTPETQKQTTDWLIAIGTIALPIITVVLSILTVFQDKMRAWVLKPKISATVGGHIKTPMRTRESLLTETQPKQLVNAYSFSLLIHNKGNQRAEEVEVFASKLFHKQADGSYKEVKSFPSRNLSWTATEGAFAKAISPGMQRRCELCAIINPSERAKTYYWDKPELGIASEKTILGFDLISKPFSRTHLVGPGDYRLVLHIAAANIKPQQITVEVCHTGQWFDDEEKMFSQGLGMKIV